MGWIDFALGAVIAGAIIVLVTSPLSRVWAHSRHLARLCFQTSGVIAVSWFLVMLAENAGAATLAPPAGSAPVQAAAVVARSVLGAAVPSILLILVALALGTGGGLLVAFLLTLNRNRWLSALAVLASLAWVVPTFLLAIFMQEVQSEIYGFTGIATSGQVGDADDRRGAVWVDGPDLSAVLVRGDQVAGETTERRRGDRDPALELRRVTRDGRDRAATIDCVDARLRPCCDCDKQSVAEAPGVVEGNAVLQSTHLQGGEAAYATLRIDCRHTWARRQPQRVERVGSESAAGAGNAPSRGQRNVGLLTARARVATTPDGKRP